MNVQALLAQYGSPAYVYDLARVRAAHTILRDALPEGSLLYYSLKANPHPALVHQLYVALQAQGGGRRGTHALTLALERLSGSAT